jgi:hypothetical protein
LIAASMFWFAGLRIDPDVSRHVAGPELLPPSFDAGAELLGLQRRPPSNVASRGSCGSRATLAADGVVVGRHRRRRGDPAGQLAHPVLAMMIAPASTGSSSGRV